jgi:hypothetical protein
MATGDGRWRVEVIRRGTAAWFQVRYGDRLLDWLDLEQVQQIRGQAGVDMAALGAA